MANDLSRNIGGVHFRNPVLTASGTFGMGEEFEEFFDYSKIGGIVLKTITPKPRKGNPPPRILETQSGLLNSIGLENKGLETTYQELIANDRLKNYPTNVIFSLAGDDVDDYRMMAEKL